MNLCFRHMCSLDILEIEEKDFGTWMCEIYSLGADQDKRNQNHTSSHLSGGFDDTQSEESLSYLFSSIRGPSQSIGRMGESIITHICVGFVKGFCEDENLQCKHIISTTMDTDIYDFSTPHLENSTHKTRSLSYYTRVSMLLSVVCHGL